MIDSAECCASNAPEFAGCSYFGCKFSDSSDLRDVMIPPRSHTFIIPAHLQAQRMNLRVMRFTLLRKSRFIIPLLIYSNAISFLYDQHDEDWLFHNRWLAV